MRQPRQMSEAEFAQYQEKRKQKHREYSRKYSAKNRERERERVKDYREANKEAVTTRDKERIRKRVTAVSQVEAIEGWLDSLGAQKVEGLTIDRLKKHFL